MTQHTLSRRRLLGAMAGAVGGAALTAALPAKTTRAAGARAAGPAPAHLAWVWVFDEDGKPEIIRHNLARNGMGVLLKTHDGTDWMGKWDKGNSAITGPDAVRNASQYFESQGVPFHAWCVVQGEDPVKEAYMADAVLKAGARSLTFDLEPKEGNYYWQAGPEEAAAFGRQLRELQPGAHFAVAPDPRPWQVKAVPMAEFAQFTNEVNPQTYWRTFDSPANHKLMRDYGVNVTDAGITPELLLDVTQWTLQRFGRPIRPVGQGAAGAPDWQRFVSHAFRLGMSNVSVWRYGTANDDLWPLLGSMPSPTPQVPPANPVAAPAAAPAVAPAQAESAIGEASSTTAPKSERKSIWSTARRGEDRLRWGKW